jgi:predicted membrane channel-forming protein YqfA (hemolysin III family)
MIFNNPKIRYRFYQTSQACLKSIFMIHNETANIWSHLLGFLFMSWLCIYGFNVRKTDSIRSLPYSSPSDSFSKRNLD